VASSDVLAKGAWVGDPSAGPARAPAAAGRRKTGRLRLEKFGETDECRGLGRRTTNLSEFNVADFGPTAWAVRDVVPHRHCGNSASCCWNTVWSCACAADQRLFTLFRFYPYSGRDGTLGRPSQKPAIILRVLVVSCRSPTVEHREELARRDREVRVRDTGDVVVDTASVDVVDLDDWATQSRYSGGWPRPRRRSVRCRAPPLGRRLSETLRHLGTRKLLLFELNVGCAAVPRASG